MNIFKQFGDSLYSAKKMAAYRKQGLLLTFVFIILLNLIASIPTFFQTKDFLQQVKTTVIPVLVEQLPKFEIKDGKYISKDTKETVIPTDQVTLKFSPDRETSTTSLDKDIPELEFLSEKLAIKIAGEETLTNYDALFNVRLTTANFLTFAEIFSENINAVFAIYMAIFLASNFLFLIVQIFLISFFGYILMKQEVRIASYKEIWLVSVCAMVIPTIFFTIMALLKVAIPFTSLIFWGSAIFILYQIIKEFPQKKK